MNELVIKDELGSIITSEQVENILNEYYEAKAVIDETEKKLRQAILTSMLNCNVAKAKVGKYNLTLANTKPTEVFNELEFLEKENKDIVDNFVSYNETESFDFEKFKEECPEIYEKYLNKTITKVVDSKKLNKALPQVYMKYVSFKDSDKKVSLRITEAKK